MKRVALCGGSGSGKGEVSAVLRSLGYPTLDSDAVSHMLTSAPGPAMRALCDAFGRQIQNEDGSLNRRFMAELVFSGEGCAERRELLNSILHVYVRAECTEWMNSCAKSDIRAAFIEVPLLFEAGMETDFDFIVAVIAEPAIRLKRIVARDKISEAMAKKRIASQRGEDFLRAHSDFVIENNGDYRNLQDQVHRMLASLS